MIPGIPRFSLRASFLYEMLAKVFFAWASRVHTVAVLVAVEATVDSQAASSAKRHLHLAGSVALLVERLQPTGPA